MNARYDFILVVAPLTLTGMLLAGGIIYFFTRYSRNTLWLRTRLKQAEEEKEREIQLAVNKAREEERSKIATNLHDSVGAELSILKLKLTRYSYFLKNNLFFKSENFARDINEIDQAIENVKAVCRDLYPETIRKKGVLCAMRYYVKKLNGCGAIQYTFHSRLRESQVDIDDEARKNLFRLFQESINNIIKHSECSRLNVYLRTDLGENKLILELRHNGKVFTDHDAQQAMVSGNGLGLLSINGRVKALNGRINYFRAREFSVVRIKAPMRGLRILEGGMNDNSIPVKSRFKKRKKHHKYYRKDKPLRAS